MGWLLSSKYAASLEGGSYHSLMTVQCFGVLHISERENILSVQNA